MWHKILQRNLRSLWMHRLRALLSTLGILFGVVAVVAMLSIGEGAKRETLEQIEQLGMHNLMIRQTTLSEEQHRQALERRSQGLTLEDARLLAEEIPHLAYQAPIKAIEAALTGTLKEMAPEILAVTRAYSTIKGLQLTEGRFICDQDSSRRQLVCVLGYDVARWLGRGGHIGQTIRIENVNYQIIGILNSMHWKESKNHLISTRDLNKTIFIPLGTELAFLRKKGSRPETLSEIILQMREDQAIEMTARLVKKILSDTHHQQEDYQIIIPQELLRQANRTQKTFNLVLGSIAAISLLVGGIGIMNIMLATVSERIVEIGIRRAVGANKKHIMGQFLMETVLLTLIGALSGILIGIGASFFISYFAGWKTIVTPWSLLLSLGMASGVGLCSGLYPAFKAAQMHPLQALRHR